jgi:heme/copper-type cytochrome/quinol oxidase subunit 3
VSERVSAAGDAQPGAAAMATASVGMIVALTAVGMTFAALLLAYGIVRVQAPAWPPPGETPLPPLWVWRITATLASLAGSAAMARGARSARAGQRREVGRALGVAAAAGTVFLTAQAAAFAALGRAGITAGSGLAASVVYALCLFHGLHALVALALLVPLREGRRPGMVASARLASIAAFWHLVTAVWIAMFVGVFVL